MRTLFKKSFQSGFTLVEIMVSVGLLSIVSLALINLYDFFGKSVKKTRADLIIEDLDHRITYIVTDKEACENTLKDVTILADYTLPAATSLNVPIRDYSDNIRYNVGNTFPETASSDNALVRISKIYPHDFDQINTHEYTTNDWRNFDNKESGYRKGVLRLTIVYDVRDSRDPSTGTPGSWGRVITRDILLGVTLERSSEGDIVVGCSDYKDTAMTTSIKNVCDDLDGTITYNNGQMFCSGTQQSLLRELRGTACRYFALGPANDSRGYAVNCISNEYSGACNGKLVTGFKIEKIDEVDHLILTCNQWGTW